MLLANGDEMEVIMKLDHVFEQFYHDFQAHLNSNYYCSEYGSYRWLEKIEGCHLMALGRFNLAIEDDRELKSLQRLYCKIIRYFIKRRGHAILSANLYMLRGYEIVGKEVADILQKKLKKALFDYITTYNGRDSQTTLKLDAANVQYNALGYLYCLKDWLCEVQKKFRGNETAIFSSPQDWYAKAIDQEFKFLATIKDIFYIDINANTKFYNKAYDICLSFAYLYLDAGVKDKAVEAMELSLKYSDMFKKKTGKSCNNSKDVKKKLRELTGSSAVNSDKE